MTEAALDQALRLARSPGLVRRYRAAPLPDGMVQVLRIAAGDGPTLGAAAASTERSIKSLQEAAAFYIVQILLSPSHDSYRTLGANPGATRDELRTNMVWLLKWLHPDTHEGQPHTVFATRVTRAWEMLRNDGSREAYDAERAQHAGRKPSVERPVGAARPRVRGGVPGRPSGPRVRFWRRWAVPVVLGSLVASGFALAALYLASIFGSVPTPEAALPHRLEVESSFRH